MFEKWRFERSLKALANSEHAVLRDYASASWPERDCLAADAPYCAVDFELDGLRKDSHLLQVGWAAFEGKAIRLGEARSIDIRSTAELDANAVIIHGIGEQRASEGEPLGEVLGELIRCLSGRILVAHAAGIETAAIQRVCKKLFGAHLPIRSICTLMLERSLRPHLAGGEAYRLWPTRERYGLPDYRAHDALTDALSAAELFQAQLSRLPDDTTLARLESH